MKQFCVILLLSVSLSVFANMEKQKISLEKISVNPNDRASVLRGAKFYAKNCMVCHTMRYLQHNKIAAEAGITLDKMPLKQKEWWLGIVPPDLTLIARQKSPPWLFTYFHSFYKDSSRPTGYNNLLEKNVNMTNVFAVFQGVQELTPKGKELLEKDVFLKPHYYTVLELVKSGSMTPTEFNQTMTDLVNFLVYASDPSKYEQQHLGIWVILFLVILAVLAYILKKMYWKDVK